MTDQSKTEHDVLTAEQAAKEAGISVRVVLDALRSGSLKGNNLQGRKGWITTRRALTSWIEGGNTEDEASAV